MDTTYTGLLQSVVSITRENLSPTEFATLLFIMERTVRFKKDREEIPQRHFLQGVFRSDGQVITTKACGCRKALRKALDTLQSLGYITVLATERARKYVLNAKQIIADNFKIMAKLKSPKKERVLTKKLEGGNCTPRGVAPAPQEGVVHAPHVSNTYINTHSQADKSPDASAERQASADKVQETMTAAMTKSQELLRKKAEKSNYDLTQTSFNAAWATAMKAVFPDSVIVNRPIKRGQFFKLRAAHRSHQLTISFTEFLEWSLDNWGHLRLTELSWADNMPEYPDPDFYASLYRHFIEAYGSQQHAEQRRLRRRTVSGDHKAVLKANSEASRARREADDARSKLIEAENKSEYYKRIAADHQREAQRAKRRAQRSPNTTDDIGAPMPTWEELQEMRNAESK